MGVYATINQPFVAPQEYTVMIPDAAGKKKVEVRVMTRRLERSAHYLYSAYVEEFHAPILELISRPNDTDLADALTRARSGVDANVDLSKWKPIPSARWAPQPINKSHKKGGRASVQSKNAAKKGGA